MPGSDGKKERIAKFMARAGVASRREAERMIAAGRVRLNGAVVAHPATMVGPDDRLVVDAKAVGAAERSRLWRYHKPAGVVTTARDPEERPTVFAALPANLPRVVAVGRLDINTEGLLLLTNDGGLARYLERPENELTRIYRVRAHGMPTDGDLARLAHGVTVRGVRYRPVGVQLERQQGGNCWLALTLHEGKNREIKNLLEALGMSVTRLIRIAYGPFELGDLARGAIAEVARRRLRHLLPSFFDDN